MNPAVTIKNEKTEKNEQTLIEKITRHISLSLDDPGDYQPLELLGKALSSQIRLKILYLLKHQSLNIVELAKELQIPVSSTAFHINLLEEAGLITAEMLPGIRGSQKVCSSRAEDIKISINNSPPQTPARSFPWTCPSEIILILKSIPPAAW